MSEFDKKPYESSVAEKDCSVYCSICGRTEKIKKGETIPICCGRRMDVMP